MSKDKKLVPIKKVLPKVMGSKKSDNYLKGLSFVYIDAQDIYENSLTAIMNGETEKCLKLMIFGLDIDRSYKPLLNLCRTMMYGISSMLKSNDFETYKHKYKDFEAAKASLTKKLEEFNKKKLEIQNEIDKLQDMLENSKPELFSIKNSFVAHKLRSIKLKPIKQQHIAEREKYQTNIEELEHEISPMDKLINLESSMEILKLIVEICTVPVRFEWALAVNE